MLRNTILSTIALCVAACSDQADEIRADKSLRAESAAVGQTTYAYSDEIMRGSDNLLRMRKDRDQRLTKEELERLARMTPKDAPIDQGRPRSAVGDPDPKALPTRTPPEYRPGA